MKIVALLVTLAISKIANSPDAIPTYKLEGAGREFVLRFEEGHLEN